MLSWRLTKRLSICPLRVSFRFSPFLRISTTSYHVHIRNWSKAGHKYVCFHLCDATCKTGHRACKECDTAQNALNAFVEECKVWPTSRSRSQSVVISIQQSIQDARDVIRVNFVISADVTEAERKFYLLKKKKIHAFSYILFHDGSLTLASR